MSGKRLGKYNFGFAVDQTAKSKSKDTSFGIAKVIFRPFFLSLYLICLQAVCVTACGNFAIVGSSIGQIGMWNLQSGIKRKTFKLGRCPPETANRFNSGNAKGRERSISGITTDSLNKYVIATTLDGTINVGAIYNSVWLTDGLPISSLISKLQNWNIQSYSRLLQPRRYCTETADC